MPDIGFFGLHAACLEIESVFVDGEPAEYEYYPHQFVENDQRWGPISSTSSAADVASSAYLSALEREMGTNLLINCCKGFRIESEQQDQLMSENGLQSSAETKQVLLVIFNTTYSVPLSSFACIFHLVRLYEFVVVCFVAWLIGL